MFSRFAFLVLLIILLAAGAVVNLGNIEQDVSLDSVSEVWSDVLRDVDQFGFKLTRVSAEREMELGKKLAKKVSFWFENNPSKEAYVSRVSQKLLPNLSRKDIKYEFHVIKSSRLNAFALPGGQVFVMSGMLDFVSSEAELAAILGHEMAHVDLRHCVELFQYELFFEALEMEDIGMVVDLLRRSISMGYRKYQELDADSFGLVLMKKAGYDPSATVDLFTRLKAYNNETDPARAKTPVGEVARVLEEALDSYYDSHPVTTKRINRLKELIRKNKF